MQYSELLYEFFQAKLCVRGTKLFGTFFSLPSLQSSILILTWLNWISSFISFLGVYYISRSFYYTEWICDLEAKKAKYFPFTSNYKFQKILSHFIFWRRPFSVVPTPFLLFCVMNFTNKPRIAAGQKQIETSIKFSFVLCARANK